LVLLMYLKIVKTALTLKAIWGLAPHRVFLRG